MPKPLPVALGLAENAICDCLYVDRGRISSLYAQLFLQGTLTSVKTTAQDSFADDKNLGSDIKVFKVEAKSTNSGSEGIERVFDPTWAVPFEVLARLNERSLIRSSLADPQLGIVVLIEAYIRIIDYATMKDLWEPAFNMFGGENVQGIVGLMKSIPHAMHAHFLTTDGYLWAALEAQYLTVPASDIVLKYGGSLSGQWKVLFVLDSYPETGLSTASADSWAAGQATDGVFNAIRAIRELIGRPFGWFGVTPLMIFREIPPYAGQGSLPLGSD